MTLLLVFIALTLGISFLCSLLEAAFLSLGHGYVEALRHRGRRSGVILAELKERVDRPLAAILTLNTIANTLGAAGVGSQALRLYNQHYGGVHGGRLVALVSALLTLGILVGSEIIPKTLGAVHARRLAPMVAYTVRGLMAVTYPLVLVLEMVSRLVAGKRGAPKVSREEMMAVAELGKAEGTLLTQETRIIQNLLRLHRIRVADVLTPRSVLLAFPKDKTVQEVLSSPVPLRFSRIPVYEKDLDDITGVVHRYQLVQAQAEGRGTVRLEALAKEIRAVPETKSVAGVLDDMIRRREHIFLVVDEYGGTAGIVTLEDAIETLLGVEIVDEFDTVDDMRKYAAQLGEQRRGQR